MALVLHLDDEIPVLEAAGNQIGELGHRYGGFHDVNEAKAEIRANRFDALIVEPSPEGYCGQDPVSVIELFRELHPESPIQFQTVLEEIHVKELMREYSATYSQKATSSHPFDDFLAPLD
ncbi:hypothetical protein CMI48_01930 [Candidatus Pacearchaeota archaeon]|nr:hypothetical protein [Candidatus Pacearchaeota archaeon]